MQNFWRVTRCFTGDVKMVNMLTTSLLYLFYYYFLILHFKNARSTFGKISFDQCPFMNCFALLFSSLMDLKYICSLNKHLFRQTTLWCWPLSLSSHLTVTMLSIRRKPLKDGQPTLLKPSTDN